MTLRGVDVRGDRLDIDAVLDNLSGGGLYLRVPAHIELGARLAVGISLYDPETLESGARIAARGVIKRVELTNDGQYGIAVEFVRSRVF